MQELIGAFSAPVALETVGDDAAHAEGLMRVTLLYRPQDDPPRWLRIRRRYPLRWILTASAACRRFPARRSAGWSPKSSRPTARRCAFP